MQVTELESDLFGVTTMPAVGIGQQSLLVRTPGGNLLWDPVGYVDEAGAAAVRALGEVRAIVASHPHMYGAQVSWSRALGDPPVLVAESDAGWVQRQDAAISTFTGDIEPVPGVTVSTIGGHFPGSLVAYWAAGAEGGGVLFCGDTVFPGPSERWVSFLRSYPNQLPLSAAVVDRVATAVTSRRFDRLYGNFGRCIRTDARAAVRRSADRHIAWVRGDYDHLT